VRGLSASRDRGAWRLAGLGASLLAVGTATGAFVKDAQGKATGIGKATEKATIQHGLTGARRELVKLVDGFVGAANTWVDRVEAAGVPDIAGGQKFAAKLRQALDQVGPTLAPLRAHARAVPVNSLARFESATTALAKEITRRFDAIATQLATLDKLNTPQMTRMAKSIAACRKIGA
jgi:hypothetical protein